MRSAQECTRLGIPTGFLRANVQTSAFSPGSGCPRCPNSRGRTLACPECRKNRVRERKETSRTRQARRSFLRWRRPSRVSFRVQRASALATLHACPPSAKLYRHRHTLVVSLRRRIGAWCWRRARPIAGGHIDGIALPPIISTGAKRNRHGAGFTAGSETPTPATTQPKHVSPQLEKKLP